MRRVLIPVVVAVAVVAAAATAYAYFASTGSGSGPASSGSLSAISISASTATPTTALVPGGTSDATLEIDNPNAVSVTVVSITESGPITVTGAPGCTSGNSGVTYADQVGLSLVVPAHATGFVVDLPGALTMANASANVCQGATFSIPVTATANS